MGSEPTNYNFRFHIMLECYNWLILIVILFIVHYIFIILVAVINVSTLRLGAYMKKKLLLVCCTAALMLSACGGGSPLRTADTGSAETEEESVEEGIAEETTEVQANTETVSEEAESAEEEKRLKYSKCIENIKLTGEQREDKFFKGYEFAMPVAPGTTDYMRGAVGAAEGSDDLWLLFEFDGTDATMQGFEWTIDVNGEDGRYEIHVPLTMTGQDAADISASIFGVFDISTYNESNSFIADEVVFSDPEFSADDSLVENLKAYPKDIIPTTVGMLEWWLKNNGLGFSLIDLGIGIESDRTDSNYQTGTNNGSSSFTNKYGTPTTKCAHPGCNKYIAPSGDTNCCVTHSNRCADCGKFIDEDAMYCMDCLTKAVEGSNSGKQTNTDNSSSKKNGKKCTFLENGVEVCNNEAEEGSPYCSYHKKLLDDAYNSLVGE